MAEKAGFRVPDRTATLAFNEDFGDYVGAEVRVRLSVSTDTVFEIMQMKARSDAAEEDHKGAVVVETFKRLASEVLVDWNLENEHGALPLIGPHGGPGCELWFSQQIIQEWIKAVTTLPGPLSGSSANGVKLEKAPSQQMEPSLPNQ